MAAWRDYVLDSLFPQESSKHALRKAVRSVTHRTPMAYRRNGKRRLARRRRPVLGPRRMPTRLRFADQFVLDAGAAGAAAVIAFSANGLFDPEGGGGSHQPRGFDQYMAMWTSYGVTKAKITVQFGQDSTATDASICGISVQEIATTTTSVLSNMENFDIFSKALGPAGSGGPITITKTVNILKYLGRRGNISDDDDLQGSATANPTDGVFFHVWAGPMDPAVDNGPINCICYIDYWVDFFQHTRPAASEG